jgi:branched-chain amino acid transport system permease protein
MAGTFAGTFPRLLSPASTPEIALRAIPGVVIGGMGSIGGAIAGGAVVGLVEIYTARYAPDSLGSNFHLVMPYLVMMLVLVVRPQGLFGEKEVRRV